MRTLNRNKQRMFYSSQTELVPIYETNSDGSIKYINVDGTIQPVTTGQTRLDYCIPIEFLGNISFGGGETQSVEFGIDVSNYDATLLVDKGSLNLSETSLIWYKNEIKFKDKAQTVVDPRSADYRVKKITTSLNAEKYLLERVIDNGEI